MTDDPDTAPGKGYGRMISRRAGVKALSTFAVYVQLLQAESG